MKNSYLLVNIFVLYFITCFSCTSQTKGIQAKLHYIIVGDTSDPAIGASCKKDLENLRNQIVLIARHTGMTKETAIVISDEETATNRFELQNVQNAIRNLNPGSQDLVIFAYSGHGSRSVGQSNKFPNMNFPEGGQIRTLNLQSVYNDLIEKNPRLVLVLGDLCNKKRGYDQENMSNNNRGKGITPEYSKYSALFRKAKGYILAVSAQPNQAAWGNNRDGGIFTNAFLHSLNQELTQETPRWKNILENTISKSCKVSRKEKREKKISNIQIPMYQAVINDENYRNLNATCSQYSMNDLNPDDIAIDYCQEAQQAFASRFENPNTKSIAILWDEGGTVDRIFTPADFTTWVRGYGCEKIRYKSVKHGTTGKIKIMKFVLNRND